VIVRTWRHVTSLSNLKYTLMSVAYANFGDAFGVETLTVGLQNMISGTPADRDHVKRENREKLNTRQAAIDISNKYSGRLTRNVPSERTARRSKPYHDDRRRRAGTSSEETRLSKKCTYISPEDGKRCEKVNKSPQEAGRHWRSCHLNKEAKLMLENKMSIDEGVAVTSMAQLEEIKALIMCRHCGTIITRSDSMQRHVKSNCKASL
jgi:hypothetical protein